VLLVIVGGIALGLRALDAVPPRLLGEPRATRAFATVFDLERDQRTRLLVPFVFPDSVLWPPARIQLAPGRGRPVLMTFLRADRQGIALQLAQALDGDFEIPVRLLRPAAVTNPLDAAEATDVPVVRATGTDGRSYLEVRALVEGRRVVLRWFSGDPAPLRRMARSLRRG
jgi:hypothetical protein